MTRPLFAALVAATACVSALRAQQLRFTPYHANGIYDVGERVGWTVAAAPDQQPPAGPYSYVVKRDGLAPIDSGTFTLSSGGAKIETSLAAPGMVLVEVHPPSGMSGFRGESRSERGRVLLGAAVAPTEIRASGPRPVDFEDFWAAKIRELDAIPSDPVLTPGESEREGVEYWTIRMDNIHRAHVYGQLARPAREGKFPALLILQWASPPYPLPKEWVTDRAAEGWLAMNVEPHDVPSDMPQAFYDALPQRIKDYQTIGQRNRNENYFLRMYLGDYRAAEYLASRPDWDGKTLVVMGTSMGGQQSFSVAGLDSNVTAMIVNVPAGCDVLGPLHGRAAPYPRWDVSQPDIRESVVYFDAMNFASHITARAFVAMGFIDETSPPAGIWAAFNRILGPKVAAPMIDSPHNHLATPEQQRPYTEGSAKWLDVLVHGGDPTASGSAVHRR